AATFPDRIAKIRSRIREVRGSALNESAFFDRHRGTGPYWTMIEQLFDVAKRKAGFPVREQELHPPTFRRPGMEQTVLF
ncbi:MAG: radical SAM protein, partial [Nitrospira sp.]|nr:radical SAM protein [Nitrospira sp.]